MKHVHVAFAFFILALSVTAIPGCKSSGKKIQLGFNFQKGKTYEYVMDFDITQHAFADTMTSHLSNTFTIEVTDDQNNIKTLKNTFQHMAMKMNMPNGKIELDSDMPLTDSLMAPNNPASMMAGMFTAMKGRSIFMKVNREGQVLEVSGITEMMKQMLDSMKISPELKSNVEQIFAAQFNEQTLKQTFSQAFNIFPAKPVQVGESWTKTISIDGMAPLHMVTTYTVKSIDGNQVTLDAKSQTKVNENSGVQNATYVVDATSGMIREGTIEANVGGNMPMTSRAKIKGKEL